MSCTKHIDKEDNFDVFFTPFFSEATLKAKYTKHQRHWPGFSEYWHANQNLFAPVQCALLDFISSETTLVFKGQHRGKACIHCYNQDTGQWVGFTRGGAFISFMTLDEKQSSQLETKGWLW